MVIDECLISNLSLMMLRALGSRVYPTLNVKYDGRRVQHIDGIPACTQKHMCVQLRAASIVFFKLITLIFGRKILLEVLTLFLPQEIFHAFLSSRRRTDRSSERRTTFWLSMLSAVSLFSCFSSFYSGFIQSATI